MNRAVSFFHKRATPSAAHLFRAYSTPTTVPEAQVALWTADGPKVVSSTEVFKGKVVAFSIPGAFTPVCQNTHVPGFVEKAAEFKKLGVRVSCISVNDPFVLEAFKKECKAEDIEMIGDFTAELCKSMGKTIDATGLGLGVRGDRFAFYAEDGVIKSFGSEESPLEVTASSAESMLKEVEKSSV
ncbi:hypothetical protein CYMTET_47123 [Cymbomonas tetramitiformis]|uniref:Glutaredoxin-dependent peroxiredoxin n=1 Tax=Cymbomonas tetramitiformis TaxID=36881 RepID=A0AAE0EWV8_9CHLO|nr:hypothetical protein CYMTET_47123 [Cymbomonas tetramitiformis]|eukprot:gene6801-8124_t